MTAASPTTFHIRHLLPLLMMLACISNRGLHGFLIEPPCPVPDTEPGLAYGVSAPATPAVKLEIFIEVHCPDSLAAWPIMKAVSDHYTTSRLNLVVHQLPLPYHRNSFLATQGIYLIQEQIPNKVFDYIEANLANWSNFSTANTVNKTETEVLNNLADLAVASTGIDKALFTSNIGLYRSYTVAVWKYGVRRNVAATPTFFTNGVELGIGTAIPSYDDWITFLDPIINKRRTP
jgi:hypothetical protein